MITIGITGGIGSGKSTISHLFEIYGIPVYIADVESKKLTDNSPIIRKKLIELFGSDIYINGTLNKPMLASIIFNNEKYLQTVNQIIHPEVKKGFKEWTSMQHNKSIVAEESAIIFEAAFQDSFHKVITVYTPLDMRIQRVMNRDKCTKEKVLERIKNQMPDEEKVKLSDFVIVNDNTYSLIHQVSEILHKIKEN